MLTIVMSSFMLINQSKKLIISSLVLMILSMEMKTPLPLSITFITSYDFLSLILVTLSLISSLLIILASPHQISFKYILTINLFLIMTFSFSSMIPFYISFELTIIPTFLLIMKAGNQPERNKASLFLLMYTIFASIPLLLVITLMYPYSNMILAEKTSILLNMPLFFILAFLVKLPMFLFHLWLPKAHVEAPMEGSMILAAILLKLGSYGLMRMLPLMKPFMKNMSPLMMSISLLGCLATCLTCNRQKDLKAMIAYSSVAHMALIIISLFSLSSSGMKTSILMTISHAFSSSAMFFLASHTYLPFHSRNMHIFKGTANISPNLSMWWFLTMAANIGTPPFVSLISETMAITSALFWSLTSLIPLFLAGMFMTSFSINLFSQINHNSPSSINKTISCTPSLSLTMMTHLLPLILMLVNPNPIMLLIS